MVKLKKRIFVIPCILVVLLLLLGNGCSKNENDPNCVLDYDGNVYHTVTIGTQTWMVENLRTTHFNDGAEIPIVTSNREWASLETAACCSFNNTTNTDSIKAFGLLYNGYAVKTGKLCPKGWHIPSDAEWTILENYLIANGYNYDSLLTDNNCAKALAAATRWMPYYGDGMVGNTDYPNKRNATGFTALPSGYRVHDGFHSAGLYGGWWSFTDYIFIVNAAYDRYLAYNSSSVFRASSTYITGLSVRCLKD